MLDYLNTIRSFLYDKGLTAFDRDTMLRESYRHPSGFTKIVFPSSDPSVEELRIHHWPPQSNDETDIHTHTSDFVSVVGYGALEETHWDIRDGSEFYLLRCLPRGELGETEFEHVGYASSVATSKRRLDVGAHYEIAWNKYHSVRKDSEGHAISYVLQKRKMRSHSEVLKGVGGAYSKSLLTRSLDPRELDDEIALVRKLLLPRENSLDRSFR